MINQQEIKDNGSLGKLAMEGQENGFSRHTIGSGTPGEDFTAPGLATQQPGYEGVVGGHLASSPSQYQHHASIPAPAHRHSHQQHQYPVYTPPQSHQQPNVSDHTGMGSLLRRPCLLIAKAITWLPVCFILSVVGWSYYAFVIELNINIVQTLTEKVLFIIFYHFILILFLWSYAATVFAPPCVTPPTWTLSSQKLEALATAKSEEDWKQSLEVFVSEMSLPVMQRSKQGAIRYCDKCCAIKPDRSHHCSVCGKCILKMDHHCPWVNNCVAFSNYKFFILFLGYALTYCLYLAGCTFKYFIMFWRGDLDKSGTGKFHILFLFFVSIMFCISVSSLFWYHVYLIMYNKSTLEQFRAPYFTNGGGQPDPMGWSLGKANNFMEVFGYNKWLWFFPLSTSVGDGLTFPTRIHQAGVARSYQSMQSEIGLAGSTSGTAAQADECAINLTPDMEGGSEFVSGNGEALLPNSYSAHVSHGSYSQPTSPAGAEQQGKEMTTVLDSNNRVTTRIGRPDSSYSMQ